MSVSLVDLLCQNFDSREGSHLVAHPCAHWVVRKLLEGEGGGEEKYLRDPLTLHSILTVVLHRLFC